jgi:glycosyltransferase involved in cell wall biosynthesis
MMPAVAPPNDAAAALVPKRVDLHCHSQASSLTAETLLNAIHCPECYSDPREVYAQAKRRGMDFVAITDHDTVEGALAIGHLDDVIVGEEVTCWFPEDQCKMHVLVYGITREDHAALQAVARDIYEVARYVEERRIAHVVAHPIYRQNDRLERWHVERLLLLFKGFECLNGAHSPLHREAFEPLLAWLTRAEIEKLAIKHDLRPRWPEPWVKAKTGGSDDHGLLNVGRTWTEFPPGTETREQLLDALREGTCRPGGESGSSAKLAHTFYSVAVRYYGRHIMAPGMTPNFTTTLLRAIVGEQAPPSKVAMARMALRAKVKRLAGACVRPFARRKPEKAEEGASLLKRLFLTSFRERLDRHPALRAALDQGLPPLGEHDEMLRLINGVNRDVTAGLAAAINKSVDDASFTALFETIAAIVAQQFVLSPYYFSLFHQNKERHLLRKLTGQLRPVDAPGLKVGLFTDTLDDVNGVGRFLRDMGAQSARLGRSLTIHTSSRSPQFEMPYRRNFAPLLGVPLPCYEELQVSLPPVLEILEWADRQQFDVIHVSTPGPVGLCGLMAAAMLRVPVVGTYHTDFPAYADKLTGDHRIANGTRAYVEWFYRRMAAVFSRSRAYELSVRDLGVSGERIESLSPGVDTDKFAPGRRDEQVWRRLGVGQPLRLLYCGRVSVEKNVDLLAGAFERLCEQRDDVALVFAGVGPHLAAVKQRLAGRPAYFTGAVGDEDLARLYASADLLVFPSTTDTLGQVVLEAQASGLPALVSTLGGPREIVEHDATGLVLPATDAGVWAAAIDGLLDDPARRARMGDAAVRRMERYSLRTTFEQFWERHLRAVREAEGEDGGGELRGVVVGHASR